MSEKRDVEWCPEPWRTSGDVVLSADGGCVVESPWTCCEDDLRRIVAAVNAVTGIPSEALESGALGDLIAAAIWFSEHCYPPDVFALPPSSEDEPLPAAAKRLNDALRRLGRLP